MPALGSAVLLGLALLSALGRVQDAVVRYEAKQLQCAGFLETAESRIQTETAGRVRHQTSTRLGVWQFRAVPSGQGVVLEGWLDSLTISRRSPEITISPDTDGLLGGRYRGTLSATGSYTERARPFIPDEVAEVAGMGAALDDLFPPLPPRALAPGKAWTDSRGLTIRRLRDSAASGLPLYRYELERRAESRVAALPGDTLSVPLRQLSEEQGTFVWHPLLGLVRRERRIVVQTAVPASRSVRQPVRSKVEQRVTLTRDLRDIRRPGCAAR
ncbi:MAG: hypothetical protein ACREMZ_14310 [Gemmatimonadales bacterium]